MNRRKLDKLIDLLLFIQQDFGEVSSGDKYKTIIEGGSFFQNFLSETPGGVHIDVDVPWQLRLLRDAQLHPEMAWESLLKVCENSLELFRLIIQTTEKEGFFTYTKEMAVNCASGSKKYEQLPLVEYHQPPNHKVFISWPDDKEKRSVTINYKPRVIFDLLDGLPFDRLKTCIECGKIFIQKTARERKYCSDLCKNRHNLKLKNADK